MATPMQVMPPERPKLSVSDALGHLKRAGIQMESLREKYPLVILGIRGYYSKMGATNANDRGIFDDAICLFAPALDNAFSAFNGNTDPSSIRKGQGFGTHKGMACLKPGIWSVYRFSMHVGKVKPPYLAICQRAGPVTVIRDGEAAGYEDTGNHGINIHRGGNYQTSSEGCQTIPRSQWDEFIATAQDWAAKVFGAAWQQTTLTYVLVDAR